MFSKKMHCISILIFSFCLIGKLTAASTWVKLSPGTSPSPRDGAVMAFDAAAGQAPGSGQMILFGGGDSSGVLGDTWNWNGSDWEPLSPSASPSPRTGAVMAFDPAAGQNPGSGQMILFGGEDNFAVSNNETWNWTGTTWVHLSPSASPPIRSNACMAYDPATGQMILFGGINSISGILGDTWNWTGTTWQHLSPLNSPSPRLGASLAYDSATGQLILFGGFDNSAVNKNDTWSWNGSNWIPLSPSTSPAPRTEASLAYDAATGEMILFGGQSSGGKVFGDTWNWTGSTWTLLPTNAPPNVPPARYSASLAFDQATGQLILFGGFSGTTDLNDTWNWGVVCPSEPDWDELLAFSPPGQRNRSSLAYDPATGQMILFGGGNGSTNLNDTWNWDGTTWTNVTPVSPSDSPSKRSQAAMAFDPATGQLILVCGADGSTFFNETWNWDGTIWMQLASLGIPSDARILPSMAYDQTHGQMILFGGSSSSALLADTWIWDGTTWTQQFPTDKPSPRAGAAMAFDAATGQLILFGGFDGTYQNDTWTWTGTDWMQLFPINSPPPGRFAAYMDYDQATGQLILFGGAANPGFLGDTWNWDGKNWTQLTPATAPPARGFGSMAFDQGTGQLILYGGISIGNIFADTWNWGVDSPVVTATPPSETICSGSTTSIALSADVPNTSFSWTVVENGVTGASAGSGLTIAQTLKTTGSSPGTATYTITPLFGTGCLGAPFTVVVTVDPKPNVKATPPSQTICSGDTTSIALSSNVPGTTFTWTVVQINVTGAFPGSGSTIAQTLEATGPSPRQAIYTITPTSLSGCQGDPITVVVTVNPALVARANPSSQTICSGDKTSITLTSNLLDTTFSWTVIENGVIGASAGSGSVIAQTLTAISATGTATYIITPTSPSACKESPPITVVVTVEHCPVPKPPRHFRGRIEHDKCSHETDIVHVLSWEPSTDPNVVGYKIFQDGKLIKTINNRKDGKLKLHHRKKDKVYHYALVAFTDKNQESEPVKITL